MTDDHPFEVQTSGKPLDVLAALPLPEAPYRGIEPFRLIDHRIFFQRKEDTQRLIRLIVVHRGVLIYGDSGAGKSSLINAGLIPAAMKEGFRPDRIRVRLDAREPLVVERISMSAQDTAPYLPSILVNEQDEHEHVVLSLADLTSKLQNLPPGIRPLLIFDQFEEVVTLFEEAPGKLQRSETIRLQEEIFKLLQSVLRDHSLPVKLLLVFREDYFAKLTKLFEMCPELPDQYLRLKPPSTSSASNIIRGPFKKHSWPTGSVISAELAKAVGDAITDQSSDGTLNLSELQIVCLKLWQSENPELDFSEKEVHGLLAEYLGEAFLRIGDELSDASVPLLSRMVAQSGARLITSADELVASVSKDEKISSEVLQKALKALEDTKMVRRERQRDVDYVEIASEFLVPWIATKKAERRERIRAERLAEQAKQQALEAKRHEDSLRHEREVAELRKKRRAYITAVVCLVLLVLVMFAAMMIVKQRTVEAVASEQVQRALSEKEEAVNRAVQARNEMEAQKYEAERAGAEALARKQEAEATRDQVIGAMRGMSPKLRQSLDLANQVQKELDVLKSSGDAQARAVADYTQSILSSLKNSLQQLRQTANQYPAPQPTSQ
jgi:hypothetical protein